MQLILSHENADFDALASMLAAHKLYPDATPVLATRRNRNVDGFLALYGAAFAFVERDRLPRRRVERVVLVDTQTPPSVKGIRPRTPIEIFDHHGKPDTTDARTTLHWEPVGAATTMLVEQLRAANTALQPIEATLLMLGIYEDTGSFTNGSTTPRDLAAAAWLLEQGSDLDTVRRFLEPPLNPEQQALFERVLLESETRTLEGLSVTVGALTVESYIDELSAVAHKLIDALDPAALFLLIAMPGSQAGAPPAVYAVGRSRSDLVHAGAILETLGGGGHARAAAGSIRDLTLDEARARLWQAIEQRLSTAPELIRVRDLMSHGAYTVEADERISSVIQRLRQIGHEGYPVVEGRRVVGMLTRSMADRAAEHGRSDATSEQLRARDIMDAGIFVQPDDSLLTLEQRMVETGWGQMPVVDADGCLVGIVTRTDLFRHWQHTRPQPGARPPDNALLEAAELRRILGETLYQLIRHIADIANERSARLYLVGGAVRDILLARRNLDIDFVLEPDRTSENGGLTAIELARTLHQRFGGALHTFAPFGTAKWMLDADAYRAMNLLTANEAFEHAELPDHIDFVTSRYEFYDQPTALPTVYGGSIKLDLRRRDFTINTLAVQVSPEHHFGQLIDLFGGYQDLRSGMIRVLHSLSFIDDPTRILRAVRFAHRLGFTIEPRTRALIGAALPMLGRITGERVRNEIDHLLNEREPADAIRALHELGVLAAIHPAWQVNEDVITALARLAEQHTETQRGTRETDACWHVLLATLPPDAVRAVGERLLFGKTMLEALLETSRAWQQRARLGDAHVRPSQVVPLLEPVSELGLLALDQLLPDERARARLDAFRQKWRFVSPHTNGERLRAYGLPPGPCYKRILERLRAAWLDGELHDEQQEPALIERLLAEDFCANG